MQKHNAMLTPLIDGSYQLVYESNTQPGHYLYGAGAALAPGYHQVFSTPELPSIPVVPIYASVIAITALRQAANDQRMRKAA